MKIDFTQKFTDLDGAPILADDKPLTLGTVAVQALVAQFPDEQHLEGVEKLRRYKLATMIYGASASVDIAVEDIALIKKLIGKGFATLIVGQALPMLEMSAPEATKAA